MDNRLDLIKAQFELQNRLFRNVTEVLEEHKSKRLNEFTNHIAWLAGHIVSSRFMLGNLVGLTDQEPHPALFEHGKGIDPETVYPSVESNVNAWNEVSHKFLGKLDELPPEKLDEKAPFAVPTGDKIGEVIGFFAHHEAYHIGQLGILRKYFSNEAMKYD